MQPRTASFLRAFAAWTVFVWVVFIRNVFKHGGAAFIAVHVVLALVSLAFAAGTFAIVRRERVSK